MRSDAEWADLLRRQHEEILDITEGGVFSSKAQPVLEGFISAVKGDALRWAMSLINQEGARLADVWLDIKLRADELEGLDAGS